MSILTPLGVSLLVGLTLAFSGGGETSPRDRVLRLMQVDPGVQVTAKASLAGCELKTVHRSDGTNLEPAAEATMRIDLSLYNVDGASIEALEDGKAKLEIKRLRPTERLLEQAAEIFRMAPSGLKREGSVFRSSPLGSQLNSNEFLPDWRKNDLAMRAFLGDLQQTSPGSLRIIYQADERGTGDLINREHSVRFFEFAKRAAALPAPQTVTVMLRHQGSAARPSSLDTGLVGLPRNVSLNIVSPEVARELREALMEYKGFACSAS